MGISDYYEYQCLRDGISKNRTQLMGISIMLVIIYHAFNFIYNPLWRFNIGYVGVDMLMLLSGFGLASSYEKNSLAVFYKNRGKRIYPLYFISVCIAFVVMHDRWSISTFIYNIITVGYFVDNGVNRFDWYLESIFYLYMLFPLFYYVSKGKTVAVIVTFVMVCVLLLSTDMEWWYDCFISRLPIFLLGVVIYRYSVDIKRIVWTGIILCIPAYIFVSPFFAVSLIALPLITCSLNMLNKANDWQGKMITAFGRYSFEIYCSNIIIHKVFLSYEPSMPYKILMYVFLQGILAMVLVKVNKRLFN